MGPKKAKDIVDDDTYWRLCIEGTPLNDENWNVKVILIEAAGSDQDHIYLNKFESYASEERRFVVKNICKTETVFMINQLGGEKKVKDDSLRVFEEGQTYLKEKKDVPPDVMALIIKHLILKMKEEYIFIQRQRLEVREGMKQESVTMISKAEVKGTLSVKVSEPQDPVPPPVKGKEQDTVSTAIVIDENKKYSTLLRVRGEEWRDKIYIDDYPIDGPNLYVAITGFLDPNLAEWLIKIGIPLVAIIQIRINLTSTAIPSNLLRPTKRGQSQTDMLAEKSLRFWEELQQLRINKNCCDDYKNTAFIVFTPPYWDSESLSGCNETIYSELCYLMYDIQDLTRQHAHYLNNMDIMTIPEEYNVDSYQSFYHTQIDGIPSESVNIYLVLDAVLEAVCKKHCIDETSNSSSLCDGFNLSPIYKSTSNENRLHKTGKLVKEVIKGFRKEDFNKKIYRVTNGNKNEDIKNPIIIKYGDFCKYNIFHLDTINLDNIVCSMLVGMPINKLWKNRDMPTDETRAKINFHQNMILSCFDRCDVETAELNRLLHILACRKLYNNRSSLKRQYPLPSTVTEFKKTFLKRSILAEPLMTKNSSHKYTRSASQSFHSILKDSEEFHKLNNDNEDESYHINFFFECPDISELVSATEILNQKPINHMFDNFEYFEDFTGSSALQVIYDAFNNFNCIDYKYCEVTDCFIIMVYNSHDKDGIARDEWRCHLPTPLCLQDFFDFVLEEQYDWIKSEENAYEENIILKSHSECKITTKTMADQSCVEQKEVDLDLLIEGSLKYEEMINIDSDDIEKSNSNLLLTKKTNTPLSTTDIDSVKSGKKNKPPGMPVPKTTYNESEIKTNIELPKKPFHGYDLGDRRVEFFGRDSAYFSKDGTRISTSYFLLIPTNSEFVNLNIAPRNECNEFWMHKVIGNVNNSELINTCESFRINTKSQLIYYLKKEVLKIASPSSADSLKHSLQNMTAINAEPIETEYFYSLSVTWPNGLITESVHENNSSKCSHIKQYSIMNPTSNKDEEMRCISLNGEVIVFKSNGDIEILRPDSTYFKITKSEKRIVSEDIPDSAISATNSDKSKKGKNKPNKTPSKSSKRNLLEDETLPNKENKYELIIGDFEVIGTNGIKQRWVENKIVHVEKLLIKTATDFCLGEIFSKRMDGTTILLNKDGDQVVTFTDNTRIVTRYIIDDQEIYPEWTDEEKDYFSISDIRVLHSENVSNQQNLRMDSTVDKIDSATSFKSKNEQSTKIRDDGYILIHLMYTIEHVNLTTVTINKISEKITIESPDNSWVSFDNSNNFEFSLSKKIFANFDSEYLNIKYEARSDSNSKSIIKVIFTENNSSPNLKRNWLEMTDSFGKNIIVNEEGNISIEEDNVNDERFNSDNSKDLLSNRQFDGNIVDNITTKNDKFNEINEAKSMRFFILQRDLTCSELIHRNIIEKYKEVCLKHPWCSINHYDSFGDHRSIWCILSPINLNECERWLMESKWCAKPKCLKYKDLKEDSGKGFYHWMRPYKRFKPKPITAEPVIQDRLPRAFVIRTLEQQWKDSEREQSKGAKELLIAVLRYRKRLEADSQMILNIPVQDRGFDMITHEKVQALAHRMCTILKDRLKKDAQSRAKSSITTKPRPTDEISTEGEFEQDFQEEGKGEEDEKVIKEFESVEASPNLKRYWRKRAEEFKEEQFYRYLLREGSVPPYFRNVLGGAIWWEMSKVADDAVTNTEKRKMKCVCYEH